MIWTTPTRGSTVGAKMKARKQSTFTEKEGTDKVIAIGIAFMGECSFLVCFLGGTRRSLAHIDERSNEARS
jgi:hypothetical protein